ncbi:MAG: hypothetical protein AB7E77_04935 [Desulfobulbus sp.]
MHKEGFFGQTAQTILASAAAVEFAHVVIAIQQAKIRGLGLKRGKEQVEQKQAEDEKVIFS